MSTYLSYVDAREHLGRAYTVATLRKMVHEGRLPHIKLTTPGAPGRVMFDAAVLDRWMESHAVPARAAN